MRSEATPSPGLFASPFVGGFECSTHRRPDGRRLDLVAATGHDRWLTADYDQILAHGIRTVREGFRWHLIETAPGVYDWSSVRPMIAAARQAGIQVIWDLCHYGWPDDLDIWSPAFIDRFERFSAACARLVREETDGVPFYCPVNEISYWAWAGGDVGRMGPCAEGRGGELKAQLIRAAIAGIEGVRSVDPRARIIHVEPAIHVIAAPGRPEDIDTAESYRRAQWQALDCLAGTLSPELGGRPDYIDILGLNYYPDNQWFYGGGNVPLGHHTYRPFRDILTEIHERYGRPVFVAETGAEGSARSAWLHYICDEVRAAIAAGTPVEGICLYPLLDYPGWENERTCDVGLLGATGGPGGRTVYQPLAEELARQQAIFSASFRGDRTRVELHSVAGGDRRVG